MYRNETGLQVLESGDAVRIGKGKVEWSIIGLLEGEYVHLQSAAGAKRYAEYGNVTLVRNIRDNPVAYPKTDEFEPETLDNSTRALSEEDTEPVEETSAYAKAVLFALNKLQKHVYGGTVRKNVKAKRRALGRRQKASRKAKR